MSEIRHAEHPKCVGSSTYRSILHVELTREMSEADKIEIRERISKAFDGLKDFRLSYMTEVEDL